MLGSQFQRLVIFDSVMMPEILIIKVLLSTEARGRRGGGERELNSDEVG